MKLTKDELKILKNFVKYSIEHQTGKHFFEASAMLKEIHRMEQAGEVENGTELQPLNHELDFDVAIYTNANNLAKQMMYPSFTYAVGRIERQYEGNDIAPHGRPVYETITEIKDVDSGEMIRINDHERNEFTQKDYSSVEQLHEVVTKQLDYLDRQIEQYQIQQQNLIENYNEVIDDIDSRQLFKDKQEEEVEEEYELR